MNIESMIAIINSMLKSGNAPNEELLIKILEEDYTNLSKDPKIDKSEMLRRLGNRIEENFSSYPTDVFSYIAAINLKSEKNPSDYTDIIRTLKKRLLENYNDAFEKMLHICIQKRNQLFSQWTCPR